MKWKIKIELIAACSRKEKIMATSDAQKRASMRYDKANMVSKVVKFSPNERDLLAHLEKQPNMSGYLKELIRRDMGLGEGKE